MRASRRSEMTGRLVGLQAQVPTDPYIGAVERGSRASGRRSSAISSRSAPRSAQGSCARRSTSSPRDDALAIQPLTQAVFAGVFRSQFAKSMGPDAVLDDVVAAGRELLLEAPRTRAALAIELGPRWPGTEPAILAHAVVHHLPLVQIPPRGLWGGSGQPTWALTPEWIGREQTDGDPDALVLRYLAAFGPATTADVRTWSRLTGLREVVARLKPDLRTFRDERRARAARRGRRAAAGPRDARAAAVPAAVRQRLPLARRPDAHVRRDRRRVGRSRRAARPARCSSTASTARRGCSTARRCASRASGSSPARVRTSGRPSRRRARRCCPSWCPAPPSRSSRCAHDAAGSRAHRPRVGTHRLSRVRRAARPHRDAAPARRRPQGVAGRRGVRAR